MDEHIQHHLHSILNDIGHILYHKKKGDGFEITLKCIEYSVQQIKNAVNNLSWDDEEERAL
jgi:hypothetical protein